MPPKKKGKKKARKKSKEAKIIPDRSVFDKEIAELNGILAALRTQTRKIEATNEGLEKNNLQLLEDESDIVEYLNKTLHDRNQQIDSMQKQLTKHEEDLQEGNQEFEDQMSKLHEDYHNLEQQLQADLKMLHGKLHSLEEFRLQRDEIMRKYEILEHEMEDQRISHKKEIYVVEKKFIIGKDKLKKEMEAKLRWLANGFQNVTDIRVASTTHKVIRANIALNTKLDQELQAQKKLHLKNEQLKKQDRMLRLNQELDQDESRILKRTVDKQNETIERFSTEYKDMQAHIHVLKSLEKEFIDCRNEKEKINNIIINLSKRNKILQQNLHRIRCERVELIADIKSKEKRSIQLKTYLEEVFAKIEFFVAERESKEKVDHSASLIAESSLKMGEETESELYNPTKSQSFFFLYKFLKEIQQWSWHEEVAEKLESRSDIYMPGRLGLVPKKVLLRSEIPEMKMIGIQVDGSFPDLLETHIEEIMWEIGGEQMEEQMLEYDFSNSLMQGLSKSDSSSSDTSSTTDQSDN